MQYNLKHHFRFGRNGLTFSQLLTQFPHPFTQSLV